MCQKWVTEHGITITDRHDEASGYENEMPLWLITGHRSNQINQMFSMPLTKVEIQRPDETQ